MSSRIDRTLADFVAGALSPPLIMALVGSLVFFLLEIVYQGAYRGDLQWVLFFFIFGAVLIARISMIAGLSDRAGAYGLVLGGAMWLALQNFVAFPDNPELAGRAGWINLGLIVLILWSTHRLTRDSTLIDDEEKGAGAGLLDVAGLDSASSAKPAVGPPVPVPPVPPEKRRPDRAGLDGWWDRYRRYREAKKREPRSPGIWVVYFSLAALPLFGLGQAQIPASAVDRRRYAFLLLMIYVGAGLGLLVTTSFLGLRRYLRQRNVTMPMEIALVWLLLGAVLIGTLLFVGDFLPRPADVQPMWAWTGLAGTQELEPSPNSPFRQPRDGKGGEAKPDKDAKDARDPKTANKSSGKGGSKDDPKSSAQEKGKAGSQGAKKETEKKSDVSKSDAPVKKDEPTPPSVQGKSWVPAFVGPLLAFLMKVVKWLVIGVIVLAVAITVVRGLLRFLGNFTFWAKKLLAFFENFWDRLPRPSGSGSGEEKKMPTLRAFASYADPFGDGRAEYLSAAELVRYSFAAWQAWGREHALPRGPGETPHEYAQRTAGQDPDLGTEASKLAVLYARLAYSTESLAPAHVKSLRSFWRLLRASNGRLETVEKGMS